MTIVLKWLLWDWIIHKMATVVSTASPNACTYQNAN